MKKIGQGEGCLNQGRWVLGVGCGERVRIQVDGEQFVGHIQLIGERGEVIWVERGGAAQYNRVDEVFGGFQVAGALPAGAV